MFDIPFEQLVGIFKLDHGSSYLQSILLFLILLSARGVKKDLRELKDWLTRLEIGHEVRLGNLENEYKSLDGRLSRIEKH